MKKINWILILFWILFLVSIGAFYLSVIAAITGLYNIAFILLVVIGISIGLLILCVFLMLKRIDSNF